LCEAHVLSFSNLLVRQSAKVLQFYEVRQVGIVLVQFFQGQIDSPQLIDIELANTIEVLE